MAKRPSAYIESPDSKRSHKDNMKFQTQKSIESSDTGQSDAETNPYHGISFAQDNTEDEVEDTHNDNAAFTARSNVMARSSLLPYLPNIPTSILSTARQNKPIATPEKLIRRVSWHKDVIADDESPFSQQLKPEEIMANVTDNSEHADPSCSVIDHDYTQDLSGNSGYLGSYNEAG